MGFICRVLDDDNQFVLLFQNLAYIKGKRPIASPMLSEFLPVEIDRRILIDGSEMQINAVANEIVRKIENPVIYQIFVLMQGPRHLRKRGFQGEGNKYSPVVGFGNFRVFGYAIIPVTVQIQI